MEGPDKPRPKPLSPYQKVLKRLDALGGENQALVTLVPRKWHCLGSVAILQNAALSAASPELQRTVGKRIRAVGLVSAGQFIVERYDIVDD